MIHYSTTALLDNAAARSPITPPPDDGDSIPGSLIPPTGLEIDDDAPMDAFRGRSDDTISLVFEI
jgi:hypothetical protein